MVLIQLEYLDRDLVTQDMTSDMSFINNFKLDFFLRKKDKERKSKKSASVYICSTVTVWITVFGYPCDHT
jgi:hypothetical protein